MAAIGYPGRPVKTRLPTLALVGSLTLLTGCSSAPAAATRRPSAAGPPPIASARTAGTPPTAGTRPAAGTPTAGPVGAGSGDPLPLGHDAPLGVSAQAGSVQVIGYSRDDGTGTRPTDAGYPAGTVWGVLRVRTCAGSTTAVISQANWSLSTAGAIVHPSPWRFGTMPGPPYPVVATVLGARRCLTGTVVFGIPSTASPLSARYAVAPGRSFTWRLSGS